ncbi:MAG: right-handed parallel beta-helix repeat-containing protein [Pirellulales bacterium]|nr:right-handed parallel beta-helix repeat-containing protein [Pirellulales bacterium]
MNAWNKFISVELVERLGWTLVHSLWQLTVLCGLAALLLAAMRRRTPQARYVVGCLTLLVMVVLPMMTYGWFVAAAPENVVEANLLADGSATEPLLALAPESSEATVVTDDASQRRSLIDPSDAAASDAVPGESRRADAIEPSPAVAESALAVSVPAQPWPTLAAETIRPLLPWLTGAWSVGCVLLCLSHLGGWMVVGRLRRRGVRPVAPPLGELVSRLAHQLGIRQAVALLESTVAEVPMVIGWLRPTVLLPVGVVTGLSTADLEAIVAHELAHIRRHDFLVNLLQTVAETLLFYHPAVWWISRRIRLEREYCADGLAAATLGSHTRYATALTTLAGCCGGQPGLAVAATGSQLRRRVVYLLRGPVHGDSRASTLFSGTLACLAILGAIVFFSATKTGSSGQAIAAEEPAKPAHQTNDTPAEAPTAVLRVAADGSQPYKSIQKAVDAAPEGALIQIAPGSYDEQMTINKPLTLEGAGWDKTTLRWTDHGAPWDFAKSQAELLKRLQAVKSKEEQTEIVKESQETAAKLSVLRVSNAQGVILRGMKISLPGTQAEGLVASVSAVELQNAKACLADCAVVDCMGNGIRVADGSDVEINHCLVAAVGNTGIAIGGKSKVVARVFHCDVRNCYHRGITIGGQDNSTEVARCRISGSAWHGIRYDNASPNIHDNLIFDNARSGIYASGKTAATIKNNLFYRNKMDGMSCWFHNEDTIEGNTFAHNEREGLAIVDQSRPTVRRNIFFDDQKAITWGFTQNAAKIAVAVQPGQIETNLFWRNKLNTAMPNPEVSRRIQRLAAEIQSLRQHQGPQAVPSEVRSQLENLLAMLKKETNVDDKIARQAEKLRATLRNPQASLPNLRAELDRLQGRLYEEIPLDPAWGNLTADPQFVDADKQDFSLAADSPARKARIGATGLIALASPWPMQPEEEKPQPKPDANVVAVPQVPRENLAEKIRQRMDPALRQRSLEKLQTLLSADASTQDHLSGLTALFEAITTKFERAPFRALVLPLLESENAQVRMMALHCLPRLNAKPEDLAKVVPLVDDPSPEVRSVAGSALVSIGQGKHKEQVLPALMKVLQDSDSEVVTKVIRSTWGQYSSPEFDKLLIKLSHDDRYRGITLYHCLSTMQSKSVPVCRRLIEELDNLDPNDSGRAAWGLTYGVVDEAKPIVEEALLKALPEETDDYTRGNEFTALRRVVSEKSRAYLKSVIDSNLETDEYKKTAREILNDLDRKKDKE